jgi:hypothetical protein
MKYMVELIEQGYDVRSYWIAGEPHDLTDMHLSEADIADIRYQVAVDGIPKMLYTPEQWQEIERGIRDRVDVFVYTDPQFSAEQMKILHHCLNAEALGYLDRSDVETLANPELSPEEMKEGMKELRDTHKEAPAKGKKSVLADLHAKQEQVAGTKTPEPAQAKRKTKEMEQ